VRRRRRGQKDETHAPAGRRNANDEFNHLHLHIRVNKLSDEEKVAHTATKKGMSGGRDVMAETDCNRIRQRPVYL